MFSTPVVSVQGVAVPVSNPPFTIRFRAAEDATVRLIVVEWLSVPETPVTVTVAVPTVAVLLAVKVTTLVDVAGLVPKAAVTPVGRPEADNVTLPVKPPVLVTVTVLVPVPPCVTETLAGEAESEKFGAATVVTVRLMVVVCVSVPDVPVIVTVDVPVVAVELAVNVTTLLEVVGFVPKVAVTPVGNPEAERVTLPVKPFRSATEMVLVPVEPCATETLVGDADKLKSAAAAPPAIALIRFWPLGLPHPVTRS